LIFILCFHLIILVTKLIDLLLYTYRIILVTFWLSRIILDANLLKCFWLSYERVIVWTTYKAFSLIIIVPLVTKLVLNEVYVLRHNLLFISILRSFNWLNILKFECPGCTLIICLLISTAWARHHAHILDLLIKRVNLLIKARDCCLLVLIFLKLTVDRIFIFIDLLFKLMLQIRLIVIKLLFLHSHFFTKCLQVLLKSWYWLIFTAKFQL